MDWKNAIAELDRLGVNQPQIATICGCSQGAVSLLARGKTKDPKHSLGEAIKALLDTKRREAAQAAAPAALPAKGAAADRRDSTRVNPFPDLDRRNAVEG